MAQLSDTVINGDLRISGQLYGGNVMAASLADYNSTSSPIYFGYGNDTPTDTSYLAGYTNVTSGMALKDISTGNVGVGYASHIGSRSSHPAIGGTNIPVYVNSSGEVTASLGNVGADGKSLVYINNGVIQKSGVTKGNPNLPVYISNGEVKECAYQIDKRNFYLDTTSNPQQSAKFRVYWASTTGSSSRLQFTHIPFTYGFEEGRDMLVTYTFSNEANDEYVIFNLDFISVYNNANVYHHQLHSIVVPELGCATITACIKEDWFWRNRSTGDLYDDVKLLISNDYRESSSTGNTIGMFDGYAWQTAIYLDPR